MKPLKNNLMLEKNGNENITNEIPNRLNKKECLDIGNRWQRTCPKCHRSVFHTSKYVMLRSLFKVCKNCSHVGIIYKTTVRQIDPIDLIRKCSVCDSTIQYKRPDSKHRADKQHRLCRSCTQKINVSKRPPFSALTKEKMSKYRRGKTYKELGIVYDLIKRGKSISNRKKGIPLTEKHCLALRQARIQWLENHDFIFPTFNKSACEYLDRLNVERGWNLQHALNGGEYLVCGYWVDGYDKERNIVVEYDEPFHNTPTRRIKDEKRAAEIKRSLQCQFYRYNVRHNELKEV